MHPIPLHIRTSFARFLYRQPTSSLDIRRLNVFLNAITETKRLETPIVEVGAFICGTSSLAVKFMSLSGDRRKYFSVDTFSGFTDSDLTEDITLGLAIKERNAFRSNSIEFVKKLLSVWQTENLVNLVQSDISTLNVSSLGETFSLVLVDTDLYYPVLKSLEKFHSRMEPGGIILVDDCESNSPWPGARLALETFCKSFNVSYTLNGGLAQIKY